MPEGGVGVDERGRRILAHGLELRLHVEPARAKLVVVRRQHRDAVRVDAAQIRLHHHLGGGLGMRVGHAPRAEDARELLVNVLGRDTHRRPPDRKFALARA